MPENAPSDVADETEAPHIQKPNTKEVPWCIMFLCIGAIVCHVMVLTGNLRMSAALDDMGLSVKGWANVGTGIADALHEELDELLANITAELTDAINRTMETMDMVDGMLSLMGGTAMSSGAMALRQIAMVQTDGQLVNDPFSQIMDFVTKALSNLPTFQEALETLQEFMLNLKPALEQVGIWVETFSDKIQATVEIFGTTMDKATKIFDSLMSKMSDTVGEGADLMQHETFNLFDTDGDGSISPDDLKNCGELYAIPALQGDKANELLETYDTNGDGAVTPENPNEFGLLVEDPSISGIMAVVLRAYAKRLSMVAGNVGAAKMRDEVASSVVKYFQLVCSKNLTKVGWVSDMLTNGTLPQPFTADVMAELSLQSDDPNVLTKSDVGEIVIGMMMEINSDYTTETFQLMSTPEHWESEGFDEDDQPGVVEQVQGWMQTGPEAIKKLEKVMITAERRNNPDITTEDDGGHYANLLQVGEEGEGIEDLSASEKQMVEILELMPAVAKRISFDRMHQHRLNRWRKRTEKQTKRFNTAAKRLLLDNLLHGTWAGGDQGAEDMANQALATGVPAKPETLLFAQWLQANATATADRLQHECMDYTGESMSALDAFNTQIQGMVKKIGQFINMMKKYASPSGIQHLEDMIDDFADMGMHDIFEIVGSKIVDALTGSIDSAIGGGSSDNSSNASMLLEISSSISTGVRSEHLHSAAAELLLLTRSDDKRVQVKVKNGKVHRGKQHVRTQSELLQQSRMHMDRWYAKKAEAARLNGTEFQQQPAGLSDVWEQVGDVLHEMEKVLPTAIELMKFARKEVSQVAANLDSIFNGLGKKGMAIFVKIATLYAEIWVFYFIFVFTITFSILIYGFWASGWFGGPQPLPNKVEPYVPPKSFWERCVCCWDNCCRCCVECHDYQSCFWSCIILFQVIVLLLFIMSLVFCILAGIQMFMGSSCMQIYMLADVKVCSQGLDQFSTFLSTFEVGEGEVPLSMACHHHDLLTCDLIHDKLFLAGILTVAGSFLAVGFSFELIFGIAIMHERAIWHRRINGYQQQKDEDEEERKKEAEAAGN